MNATAPRKWQNRIVGHGEEDPEQLLANPANWRIHPRAQQAALEGVLQRVGWVQDVIVNRRTGHMLDGHARVEMAISAGERVPVVYVDISEAEERLILATYDRLTGMAGTDEEKLAGLIAEAQADFPDLTPLLANITEILGDVEPQPVGGLTDPDEAPEPPAEPVTRLGDLWLCGEHRVLCGDCTQAPDFERVKHGAELSLLATDPPYGVDYAAVVKSRENQKVGGWAGISGDTLGDEELSRLLISTLSLVDSPVLFLWHSWKRIEISLRAVRECGWTPKAEIIWVKNALVFGRSDYQWRHEPCIYATREGCNRQEDRTATTVWEFDKPHSPQHPTSKPVALFEIPIRNHTCPGAAIYEPFSGSGSQFIAAESLGRRCYGLEIEPRYVDVTVTRWQNFTGKAATLEGDGRTFAEVAHERIGSAEAVPA